MWTPLEVELGLHIEALADAFSAQTIKTIREIHFTAVLLYLLLN